MTDPVLSAVDPARLLAAWERGVGMSQPERALALLGAACPASTPDDLAALPIGRRDELLLRLHEHLFGAAVDVVTACPECATLLQSNLAIANLRVGGAPRTEIAARGMTFRLPTSADLIGLPDDAAAADRALLSRCLVGDAVLADGLQDDAIDTIAAAMAAADPQADLDLDLVCPGCGHRWQAAFDIAQTLWQEVHVWAQRTLRDIHRLARAYGWREADVLALSATRRQIYLELSAS
jgi:uncharacterized protein (UPF0212 family)